MAALSAEDKLRELRAGLADHCARASIRVLMAQAKQARDDVRELLESTRTEARLPCRWEWYTYLQAYAKAVEDTYEAMLRKEGSGSPGALGLLRSLAGDVFQCRIHMEAIIVAETLEEMTVAVEQVRVFQQYLNRLREGETNG